MKIEEIRSSANIVDVISGYVQLKKRGRNYVGLCPFHQEKTPSFTVSEEKQIYHCFGCHAGGNVFKFLMDYKSVSFVEAVQEVAEHLGIPIQFEKGIDSAKQDELEILFDINLQAAKYFSNNLLKGDEGEIARKYLHDRNIKPQIQKVFGMGYALPEWEHFLQYAQEFKIDLQKAKILGLLDTRDNGEYYDKYRDRIIFPIFSPNGRVIAFGGRILTDRENTAKYLNSPESQIYYKRRSLYGLFHSKDEIRKLDKAILVEGYMDLISLYQYGVKNVVASSGTSLTEEQVQLLSRFTKNIIVLFDADPAGQKASMRSIELLLKQNFEIKVINLPKGEDPDSYINKFGREQFEELVSKAQNFLEFQTAVYEENGMLEDPAKQSEAIREILKLLVLISDELKRTILIKSISRRFGLREKLLESELDKLLKQAKVRESRIGIVQEKDDITNKAHLNGKKKNGADKENPFEKELIRLMYGGDPEIINYIVENISPEELLNSTYKYLAKIVVQSLTENISSSAALIERVENEELRTYLRSILLSEDVISKKWDELHHNGKIEKDTLEYASNTVKSFRMQRLEEQIRQNNEQISKIDDEELIKEIWKKNQELILKKKTLMQEE